MIAITAVLALQAAGCMESEVHRQFDFWAGDWNVYAANGDFAGSNTIRIGAAGCVVTEAWTNARGGTGHSLNYVEPATGDWRQIWVGRNHRIDYDGGLDGAERMVLNGEITYWNDEGAQSFGLRGAWTPLESGHVISHFQQYDPETEAWADWALLTYVPKDADPNGAAPAAGASGPVVQAAPPAFE
ncbi:MAG: hypothetical protein RKE49_12505 [Oceanicaulis sp.]